jgi:RNA polymerase sigma-70 factor (ECF subfamily)
MDENEFVKLVQQNERIVYKVISLYTDTVQDKEDLFQETLLQLWKSSKNFNAKSSFSTWMYRVALNVSLNFKRNTKKTLFQESAESLHHLQALTENKEEYEILCGFLNFHKQK